MLSVTQNCPEPECPIVDRGIALPGKSDPYMLETVSRACEVLKCFEVSGQNLKLSDIVRKTGLNKTIAFRILYTLTKAGLLERSADLSYRSTLTYNARHRFKIGYAAQSSESSFSAAVTAGIQLAAARQNIDLICMDNCFSASMALRNARKLVADKVDLVLDFQSYAKVAPAISTIFREAKIPMIAIEVPHPNAVFYGIDNYRVGIQTGRVLGRWAKQHWGGEVHELLLLEAASAGPLPQLRLSGARSGAREILPHLPDRVFTSIETTWDFLRTFETVRKYLRRVPPQNTLITGVNDIMVLAALHAFEEAGRSRNCAAVCLGAIPETRAELRRSGTRLIGAVAFFPERYGEEIIRTALDILHHREVPPAIYAHCEFVSSKDIGKYYPADVLANPTPSILASGTMPI